MVAVRKDLGKSFPLSAAFRHLLPPSGNIYLPRLTRHRTITPSKTPIKPA
jgi:hypothetical protein